MNQELEELVTKYNESTESVILEGMSMAKQINIKDLTPEQALEWLVANDSEASEYWKSLPVNGDLVTCVWENLRDFGAGVDSQSGDIFVQYDEPKLHVVGVTNERENDDTDEDYEHGVNTAKEVAEHHGVG